MCIRDRDVTIQAQVLEMMNDLKKKLNTAMLLITHDLGVVVRMCDNVAIMYAGEIVEYGSVYEAVSYTHLDVYKRQILHMGITAM